MSPHDDSRHLLAYESTTKFMHDWGPGRWCHDYTITIWRMAGSKFAVEVQYVENTPTGCRHWADFRPPLSRSDCSDLGEVARLLRRFDPLECLHIFNDAKYQRIADEAEAHYTRAVSMALKDARRALKRLTAE